MSSKNLTPTSFAILGLLAVKPWTTYELATQMERAVGLFWPRARSKLYEEPKKLVRLGLAETSPSATGRRPKTVYSITADGRAALRAWLPLPGAGPVLEFEELIKVFFAEHGSKADLVSSLERTREWVATRGRTGMSVSEEYLEGRGLHPERLPWLIIVGRLLDEFEGAIDRWSTWALETVETWPDDVGAAAPDLEALRQMHEAGLRRAGGADQ